MGALVRPTTGLRLHPLDADLLHFTQSLQNVAIHVGTAETLAGVRTRDATPAPDLGIDQLQNRPGFARYDEPTTHLD